jgi:hypothetical protein
LDDRFGGNGQLDVIARQLQTKRVRIYRMDLTGSHAVRAVLATFGDTVLH